MSFSIISSRKVDCDLSGAVCSSVSKVEGSLGRFPCLSFVPSVWVPFSVILSRLTVISPFPLLLGFHWGIGWAHLIYLNLKMLLEGSSRNDNHFIFIALPGYLAVYQTFISCIFQPERPWCWLGRPNKLGSCFPPTPASRDWTESSQSSSYFPCAYKK